MYIKLYVPQELPFNNLYASSTGYGNIIVFPAMPLLYEMDEI